MNENTSPHSGQNNRGPRDNNRDNNRNRGGSRGGRRNDSRGPRRDNGNRSQRERSNYGNRDGHQAPKPLTFWGKIVAFFSGKKATAPASTQPRSIHPTEQRAEEQRTGRPSDSYRRTETRPDRNAEPADAAASNEPSESRETRAPREERAPRSIEIIEVTSPKLYVGNLSFDAAESDLIDLFNGVGKVRNAEVVSNNYTQKSKGFAFVTMETIDEAKRAVTELHDKEFMGRKLLVSGAKTSERSAS
ncbi:MAG: hypothetical protein ABIT76_02305 [Chthoniobacterales bacterium]